MIDYAGELHLKLNRMKRYSFPFDKVFEEIPQNGIYVKFEKGEMVGNLDRIVRIGTDTGEDQLRSRLNQHFTDQNQRRSIFRKNIGRCLLNKKKSDYLKYWDLDYTSKVDKERNKNKINLDFEKEIENEISNYVKNNFSFCVFKVGSKEERLFWESKIIATIAQSKNSKPSENWLGNFSPKEKIRKFGLWQVQGLEKSILTYEEFETLDRIII